MRRRRQSAMPQRSRNVSVREVRARRERNERRLPGSAEIGTVEKQLSRPMNDSVDRAVIPACHTRPDDTAPVQRMVTWLRSAACSLASVDSILALNERGCNANGRSRLMSSVSKCSQRIGQIFHDTKTCEMCQRETSSGWTCYAGAFLAKTSVTLAHAPGLRGSVRDFGRKSPALLASWNHDTSSWKTSQRCLFGEWTEFSGTWPASGTMRSGTCYRRRPSVPLTYEHAPFYVPTLVASEGKRGSRHMYSQGGVSLSYCLAGCPHPMFGELLMGFPVGWTDLEDLETPSSRKSQSGSDDA